MSESHEDSKEDEKKHWNSTVKSNDLGKDCELDIVNQKMNADGDTKRTFKDSEYNHSF